MKRNRILPLGTTLGIILPLILASTLHAGNLIKLVESGDFEPGNTTNTFLLISQSPTINDAGQVCFNSDLRNNGSLQGYGIYLADGNTITTVARVGVPAPDFNGNLYQFYTLVPINNTNQAFQADLRGTLGGNGDDSGMYEMSSGALLQLAREGYAAPNGAGNFKSLESVPVRINRSGQVAFTGQTVSKGFIAYRSTGTNLTQMAAPNQASPDGNGNLLLISNPGLNNNGQIAFYSTTINSTNSSNFGYFYSDGTSLGVLARSLQTVPGGNGTFLSFPFTAIPLNDNGQIAFYATLSGTSGGTSDNSGLYRASTSAVTEIARKGQFAPGGNGRFLDFGSQAEPPINNSGKVAFFADLTGTTGGATDNSAIYVGDGSSIVQLARKGQPAPDGNGTFFGFGYPAINDKGQVAFTATLTNTVGGATDNQGIYLVDTTLTIHQVVRSGIIINGKTLSSPGFLYGPNYGGLTGLNNNGQMAIWATLAGDYAGFLWTPPQIKTLGPAGNNVRLTLQAAGGTTNYLQAAATVGATFHDITNFITPGLGLVTTNLLDPNAATNQARFYRIRQLP